MAAIDPLVFLRSTPPFDNISPELFSKVAGALEIAFYPAGSRLVSKGDDPLQHLYVIRKGAVRLEAEGQTLQLLEEGETFGYTSLISRKATLDVVVEEDLLTYRLPAKQFEALLSEASFAGHFALQLADRLKSSLEHSQVATFQADLSMNVEELVRRAPVIVPAGATVGEAAQVMSREGISSVLVDSEPMGIITDRDFRNRVLAAGLGPETKVAQVFSQGLKTVAAETPIYEAWVSLIDTGKHHIPVVKDGRIIGVLSSNDLLRTTAQGPVRVLRRVERMAGRSQLPGYARRVTEMSSALLAGGLHTMVVAGFVARLNDALVHRILRWAETDFGPPPCAYAWIVSGSEGRMEQTLLTDQDNALIFSDAGENSGPYFQELAERANDDLEAAGFPRCPGGYMARRWNGTLTEYCDRFRGWVSERGPQALMDAAIFADFRKVSGYLDLAPFEAAVARAGKDRVFLSALAKAALESRPPAGLLLRLRGESSEVNLKTQGITPIVHLARCYALEVSSDRRHTLERLDAAVRAGLMGKDARALVGEAFKFLNGLRLRLQLRAVTRGEPISNAVRLADLSAIERSRLKDSLQAIRNWQDLAAYHYRTDLF
jgi:CBS domain-containing protein